MTHLASPRFLRHSNLDVRLVVITCISEIMRITVSEQPYSDTTMGEIFELMIGSFQRLWDITNPYFGKRVKILENMAKVRSCVLMLDLKCDDLFPHMFEVFFVVLHDDHSQKIMVAMQTIMSLVLNEYEDPPQQLLSILGEGLSQEESCIAHTLAKSVLDQCSSKVKAYMLAKSPMKIEGSDLQGMNLLVLDDSFLASNGCVHDEGKMMAKKHVMEDKERIVLHEDSYGGIDKTKKSDLREESMNNDTTIEGYTNSCIISFNASFLSTFMLPKEETIEHSSSGNNLLMLDKLLVPTNYIELDMSRKKSVLKREHEGGMGRSYTHEEETFSGTLNHSQLVGLRVTTVIRE
ncbi:hypothetical protein KI387_042159 [Taxus chinensis]|uniref:Uncharacterized protein n=1 Tax=Taxus chinensis TaxID=29808 RepID=A0AA38C177_TAXCH|nr:hypothetical protein KI387_042159 [Taxus chinensis]